MAKQFVIIEPWGGSPPKHWQSLLANELIDNGEKVIFPRFPNPDYPDFDTWIRLFAKEMENVDFSIPTIIIGHSLGCTLWIHYMNLHPDKVPMKIYFIAPAVKNEGLYKETLSFFPIPKFKPNLNKTECHIICSDNDPFVPFEDFEFLSEQSGVKLTILKGQGHFNIKAGYGPWPKMLEDCLK